METILMITRVTIITQAQSLQFFIIIFTTHHCRQSFTAVLNDILQVADHQGGNNDKNSAVTAVSFLANISSLSDNMVTPLSHF